jgi:hypothetical protein
MVPARDVHGIPHDRAAGTGRHGRHHHPHLCRRAALWVPIIKAFGATAE